MYVTAFGHRVADPRDVGGQVGVGTANGTFGELLQGALPGHAPDGEGHFLVTLPLARWSRACFEQWPPGSGLKVSPADKIKAAAIAELLLTELGRTVDGSLTLHSSIPVGKGLASSSADLVATARAVMAMAKRSVSPRQLGEMLAAIEPTDGVMYPAIVAFDHRRGTHLRTLGQLPALEVVAVDQGGCVDTLEFNRHPIQYSCAERRLYRRLLDDLGRAVADHDLMKVGEISTHSAELNQTWLPNRNFRALREICRFVGGLGLVACHSGTMVGILLDPLRSGYRSQLSQTVRLTEDLPGRTHLYLTLTS